MGILFETITVVAVLLARRDSKALDKKYEGVEKYQQPVSDEEKEEFVHSVKDSFGQAVAEATTEENMRAFSKTGIIFYALVSIIVFVFLAVMTNMLLALVCGALLIATGIVYFVGFNLIAKVLRSKK